MDNENLFRNRGEKGAQYLGAEQGSAPFAMGPGWLGGTIQHCQVAFFLGFRPSELVPNISTLLEK